jgi:3-oxoacyl-[acyl-carrier protein] reductase
MFDTENICLDNPIQINKGFKSIMAKFKGKLDVMILCHGIFKISKMIVTSIENFDNVLNVNVRSCFHLISIATPFLKISKGNIVAISSVEARIPTRDSFLNTLSKAMLNSLLECSALELAPFGIRVNGVAPGMTYTNLRVSEVFTEMENRDYLDKLGGIFPLHKKVTLKITIRHYFQLT